MAGTVSPELILRGRDNTQAAFASVRASLQGLQREFGKMSQLGGTLRSVFAVGAISGFSRALIQATDEAERSSARLDVVLRNVGGTLRRNRDDIERFAEETRRTTFFDDDAAREAAAQLAIFRNVVGETFDEVLRLAPDVAAFFGEELPEAARELGRAFNAPANAQRLLRQAGVELSDVEVKLLEHLQATGRAAEAQAIVYEKLRSTFQGTAREMNSGMVKATSELGKAWDDLLKSFGRGDVGLVVRGVMGGATVTIRTAEAALTSLEERLRLVLRLVPLVGPALSNLGRPGATPGESPRNLGPLAEGKITVPSTVAQVQRQIDDARAALRGGKKGAAQHDEAEAAIKSLQRELQAVSGLSDAERVLDDIRSNRLKATPEQAKRIEQLGAEIQGRKDNKEALEAETEAEKRLFEAQLENRKAVSEFNALIQDDRERERVEVERTAEAYRELADPTRKYRQELEEIKRLQATPGGLNAQDAAAASAAIQKEIDAVGKKTSDVGHQLGLTFSSAIEESILQLKDLGDVAEAVFQDIARLAIRKSITEPLLGGFEKIFSGAGGGGIGSILGSLFGMKDGGILGPRGPIQSFALGGVAMSPGLVRVRDGGLNEAIVPLPNGRSIPVDMRRGAGAGGRAVNLTMNVYTQDAASFRRSQRQILNDLQRNLRAA